MSRGFQIFKCRFLRKHRMNARLVSLALWSPHPRLPVGFETEDVVGWRVLILFFTQITCIMVDRLSECVWSLICEWLSSKDTMRLRLGGRRLAAIVHVRSARVLLPAWLHNGVVLAGIRCRMSTPPGSARDNVDATTTGAHIGPRGDVLESLAIGSRR